MKHNKFKYCPPVAEEVLMGLEYLLAESPEGGLDDMPGEDVITF